MNIKDKLGPISNIEFDKLFLGQLFSHFSDAILQFILISILMEIIPEAGKVIALTFFVFLFPQFILSPVTGAICDKFSRKKVLAFSTFYRALILILFINLFYLKSVLNVEIIYVTAFFLGTGSAFFYPAKMSILPNIVENKQLKFANALNSSIGAISILFGAFIANFIIQHSNNLYALYIIISFYIVSSILCISIVPKYMQKTVKISDKIIEDMKTAINYIRSHKRALYLVMLSICIQFIVAAFSNNLNTLITDYYGLQFSDLTYLRTILGIGIILGMVATIYFARFIKLVHMFAIGFLILCIALFTANFCNSLTIAWKWLIPIGMADAMVVVMLDTVLQKVTPDRVRGKIFGLNLTLNTFSFLTGTLAAVYSTNYMQPLTTFKIIAAIAFIMALLILLFDKSFRYFILKATIGQIFLLLFRYKVEGLENLPKKGKIILAGNHTGHLDPFILQMATKRQLWFITGPEAFNVPIIKYFLKFYNVLPLKFGKGMEALDNAVIQLNKGEAVIIFPEGKFTPNGELCKFNRGVAIMAKNAKCPIVPFAIKGGFETWNKSRRLPKFFNTIVIQFGQIIEDVERDEKEIAKDLQLRVNYMKHSLERRALYNISHKMHSNFLDLMQERSDIHGSVRALSIKTKDGYEQLTYIELARCAKKFANYMIEKINIKKGDRIAILCESRPEFAIGMFASIQTGAITVPLDIKLTVNEHTNILSDCNPRVLCCSSQYLNHAIEVKNNVESIEYIFVLDKEYLRRFNAKESEQLKVGDEVKTELNTYTQFPNVYDVDGDITKDIGVPRPLDDTALIVYTSGTTGNPKGVMISFDNIYSQIRDFEKLFLLSHKNRFLSILPLNHLLELNVGLFAMLYMGAEITYIKTLSPKELTETMKEKQITNMIVVPLVAKMLKNSIEKQIKKQDEKIQRVFNFMYKIAKYFPMKVRHIMFKRIINELGGKFECFISGGAPLDNSVAEFFDRIGIPAFQGYGLTETSPVVSTNSYKNNKLGTVGKNLPSVMVKLAENGELLIKGPNVMQGYWGKEEMTKEVIDEDEWFHTGDIGEIDKEGYIKITGRIKNMIVLGGGKKIFPEEVEAVLEKSDKIKEVCVLSLKIRSGNKAGTEEVGAIIVPADNILNNENVEKIIEDEVKTLAKANLAEYKIPTVIVIHRDELPKTSTKKVKRKDLLEWYEHL